MLNLPVAAEAIARLRAKADASAYDVVTWQGRCPEEHVEAFCAMRTRMENDVPVGEIDLVPVVIDEARLRLGEQRIARATTRSPRLPGVAATASSGATPSSTSPMRPTTSTRTTPWSCPSTAVTGSARC